MDPYAHMSYWELAQLFMLPLIFTFGGFFLGSVLKRLTVNQQKQNQLIVLFFVFSLPIIFLANRMVPFQLVVLLPGMAYFISQIFIYLKKNRWKTIIFYSFFLGVPLVGYLWKHIYLREGEENSYAVNMGPEYDFTDNQAILVLGDDLGFYRNSSLAGPYLNFSLSKKLLSDLSDPENLTQIYRVFSEEKPEYVIDEEGVFANLLTYLPDLKQSYNLEREGVYRLK